MPTLVREEKYIMANVAGNNNKYWYIRQYDDHNVIVENGRVGSSPQVHPKQFSSEYEASDFVDSKIREKTKKGYSKLKVLQGDGVVVSAPNDTLENIALKQIQNSSPEAIKLIQYLSKINIHNITSSTTITYDENKGTFSTPCGIVTQDGIDEARRLLNEMVSFVEKNDYKNSEFIESLQNYLQLIPRKVGRKLIPEEIFPNVEVFQKEGQILDSLDASLQQALSSDNTTDTKVDVPKLFNAKLDLVTDQKIIDHITKFYDKTRNRVHTSYNLKIRRVFSVEIGGMKAGWDRDGAKMTNIWELWHGTRAANLLSILKGGLIIPKPSASHVTGRMFADGIYFSDQSTKSLNYSQGYWGHGARDNNCFMFLADVAMGNYHVPRGPSSNLPAPKSDSTYAQAGQSGVMNNEMIVYRTTQCNLKYLVEFSDK